MESAILLRNEKNCTSRKKKFKRNKKKMASIVKKYTPGMKFKFEDFKEMNIPNLMINIWSYTEVMKKKSVICEKIQTLVHKGTT